jgi:hypothetical protein
MRLGAMGARGGFGSAGVLGSASQSIPVTAARTYDFVNGTYTADGSATNAAAAIVGTVRTFTDDFLGDNWGAKTDPAYSNLYNVDLSTAVTGTIGSGGALPTGWAFVNAMGLSCDVTNVSATEIQIRMYGTATSSGNLRITTAGATTITVSTSTVYTISFECQQVGAITGITYSVGASAFGKGARFYTAAGGFVSDSFPVGQPIRTEDQIYVPVTEVVTTPGTGARIAPIFTLFNVPNGATIDATFKLKNFQITLGTGRMQYLGRGASASADNLTANNLSTMLASPVTPIVTARLPPDNNSGTIFELGSGSNRVEVVHSSYTVSVNVVNGGSSNSTTLGRVVPWMRTKVALSISGGVVKASLNGKPAVTCSGTAPSLTGLKFGGGTTAPLRGSVESATIYNVALNAANLKIASALSGAMYDDFDRADGAVGTAWTGQTYEQTGTAASSVISSGKVVTTDSGGATTSAYFLTDCGSGNKPKIVGGSTAWLNQAGSASAGLISTPNDTSISDGTAANGITAGSNHFLAATTGVFAGKFVSGTLTDDPVGHQWNFSSSLFQTKDGSTLYPTVWKLRSSDGVMAVRTWNGETEYFAGENYYTAAGRYVVTESYWSVAQPVGQPIWGNWGWEI